MALVIIPVLQIKLANTNEIIAINLIKMFRAGPDVSLRGSPTVSPMTAALCSSECFFLTSPLASVYYPLSIYFLALSHAPPKTIYCYCEQPVLALEIAI